MLKLKTFQYKRQPTHATTCCTLKLPESSLATTTTTLSATSTLTTRLKCSLCSSVCKNIFCLIIGLIIGIRFTDIWFNLQNETTFITTIMPSQPSPPTLSQPSTTTSLSSLPSSSSSSPSLLDSDILFNTTRVLCWILTNPSNHLTKAIHIRHTWGRRCNKLLFMSSEQDNEVPTIKLNVEEGRDKLWNKTQQALKYIHDHHINDAEWFLKADDDTYVIMENLRYFLYPYPPEAAIYFGTKFKRFIKQGYMSGGAGYVLSKESLRKFANEAYENPVVCTEMYPAEDVQLGLCLQNIGVIAGDTRDEGGNERFLPLPVEYLIPEDKTWWYKNYTFYEQKENTSCCSPMVISFHYIEPQQFYILDYFLYTLTVFGVKKNTQLSLSDKLTVTDVMSMELQSTQPIPEAPVWNET